ncbi:hypothetical protein BC827DRAFT_1268420 [Russula dissimulans]|nr:hypothetical protein BC827DRAFT_1268420 [Russula dissimulans]
MAENKQSTALGRHLNFFRIHLALFTLVQIIAEGVLSASSGAFNVKYIDALFICVSGMTVLDL